MLASDIIGLHDWGFFWSYCDFRNGWVNGLVFFLVLLVTTVFDFVDWRSMAG